MDELERALLQYKIINHFYDSYDIDDVFFIWTHDEKKLQTFLEKLNKFHPNINFTHELSKENISLLDPR